MNFWKHAPTPLPFVPAPIISMLQKLSLPQIASLLDVSAVQANSTKKDVQNFADLAIRYDCKAVFALSCFLDFLRDYRSEHGGNFLIGTGVGFPSGATTTALKVQEAKSILTMGVDEIDMMINVSFLLSGLYQEALDDIRAVKQAIGDIPLKVIIECHYFDNDLMCRAAEMVVDSGAQWVKTGTGWAPTGATYENVALLKKTVGDAVKIKASGGIRNLEIIQNMFELGVERFGVGNSASTILEEAATLC